MISAFSAVVIPQTGSMDEFRTCIGGIHTFFYQTKPKQQPRTHHLPCCRRDRGAAGRSDFLAAVGYALNICESLHKMSLDLQRKNIFLHHGKTYSPTAGGSDVLESVFFLFCPAQLPRSARLLAGPLPSSAGTRVITEEAPPSNNQLSGKSTHDLIALFPTDFA